MSKFEEPMDLDDLLGMYGAVDLVQAVESQEARCRSTELVENPDEDDYREDS